MQNIASWIIAMATAGLLLGCGKEKDASQPASPSASGAQLTTSSEAAAPNTASAATLTASEGDMTAVLGALTQAVRKYGAEKQRVPTSLSEVVGAGYIASLPNPPPGKKFAINRKLEVVLVKD